MFYGNKETRKINQFQDVRIPSARNLYERYGAAIGKGVYQHSDDIGNPVFLGNNVIDSVTYAHNALQKGFEDLPK